MTATYTIELVSFGVLKQYEQLGKIEAIERLKTPMVAGHRYRLEQPSRCSGDDSDLARYARQCQELGIENVYA